MLNFVKIARVLLAILFVFSGISKLISLPFFDGLVAALLLGPEYYNFPSELIAVQIFTRILISIELTLGVAILQNWRIKTLILPAIQGMLVIFTLHLFYEGFTNGFGGNCGCFGDVIPMSNTESIIKNILAILLGIFVWKQYMKDHMRSHFPSWTIGLLLGLVTLATLLMGVKDYTPQEVTNPIEDLSYETTEQDTLVNPDTVTILAPIKDGDKKEEDKAVANEKNQEPTKKALSPKSEKLISLMEKFKNTSSQKIPNFREGTHLVSMFSMTCSHCQEVIRDLCMISRDGKLPQQFLFNFGSRMEQNYFFGRAAGCSYPHARTEDYVEFTKLLEGNDFPRILVIKDGEIVQDWNVKTYSKDEVSNYFGIKKKAAPIDPLNPIKKEEEAKPKLPWE